MMVLGGGYFLNSFSQLFIGDNRQPLRQWLSQFKICALVPASSIFSGSSCTALSSWLDYFHTWDCSREYSPGCTRTHGCGGCPSVQRSGRSSSTVFMCFLHDLLSFLFYCRLCIWDQQYLGWKIFGQYFSVSRGMRLWETDLQSLLNHT